MMEHLSQPINIKDKKHLISIFVTVFVFISIPLTVISFLTFRNFQPKASGIRGTAGDLWADVILGKRDFTEISSGQILPYNVHKVGGVTVDRTTNHAFIFDGHNSRILGIDLNKCLAQGNACSADIVIGQPSGTDFGACNQDSSFQNFPTRSPASATTVCGMADSVLSTSEILPFVSMTTDANGRLIFPDRENHRILIYNNPWQNNAAADQVIGQADFTGNLCNRGNTTSPTASTLCDDDPGGHSAQTGAGVALDPQGNLWVADNGNNRVLRFPADTVNPGKFLTTADIVLGQTNFTTGPYSWQTTSCATLDKICNPTSLRFNPTTGDLYVADSWNKRITVFKSPFTTGMAASGTFGTGFNMPQIGEVDPSGQGLWVNQYGQGKISLWSWDGVTILKTIQLPSVDSAGSVGIDAAGDVLPGFYSGGGNNVFLYKNPLANPNATITTSDRQLFSPIPAGADNGTNGARLGGPTGIATAAGQLFVSDGARVLYWNNPAGLTSGQPADGYLVARGFNTQQNFMDINGNETSARVGAIKADADNRIWVRTNIDVRVYQAPVSAGDQPIKIIAYPFNILGGGSISPLRDIDSTGIVPTAHGEYLYFAEAYYNRVLRIKDPLTNPVVDMIFGQPDSTSTSCNQGQTIAAGTDPSKNLLCSPGSLSLDRQNNLYVSDGSLETSGNWRLLMFASSLLPTTNTSVVYDPTATKSFPKGNPSHFTFEPAFDSTNRMVVGVNPYSSSDPTVSRFVQYYNDPVNGSTTPTGHLNDYYSLPIAATFDNQDNLYVVDGNRSRVMIYKNPFNNANTNQPATTTPTTTLISNIAQGSDDAYYSCNLGITTGDVRVGYDNGGFNCQPYAPAPITAGLRFQNLNIPQGAKITGAYLSWIGGDSWNTNALNMNIAAVAQDNVATFSSTNLPTTLPTTAAVVNDNVGTYPWKGGFPYESTNVKSVIQEVVNRSGWVAGNALAFIITNNGSTLNRRFPSFEGAGATNPTVMPQLVVQYTTSTADTTPPTVSITSPTSGSTVSATTTVAASASDNVSVARVDFLVDGTVASSSTTSPYQFNWDTTKFGNSSHQLTANAYDGAGNVGTSSLVTVSVSNGDTTAPSTPTGLTATTASATQVNLNWTASTDNVGVAGYYIVRNGTTISTSTTNSFSDTTVSPSTLYSYNVIAYDAAGNKSGLSNTYNVTTPALADTAPPTAPTNLAATAVSSSQINLSWTASTDNVGVTSYDIYRNGSKLTSVGSVTSFGDTGLTASTTYSYYIIAKDAAGNSSTASGTVSATTQAAPVTQGTLTGTVKDASNGSLLSGATVTISISSTKGKSTTIASAVTNSSGVYLIVLTQGSYKASADAPNYAASSQTVTITAGSTTTANFSLSAGGGKRK